MMTTKRELAEALASNAKLKENILMLNVQLDMQKERYAEMVRVMNAYRHNAAVLEATVREARELLSAR